MFQQRDKIIKPTYKLGSVVFSITNCDAVLEREFEMLLPICPPNNSAPNRNFDAQKESINHIVDLINLVHKKHEGTLWILAASVVSPSGRKVLISGPSHAGKSTMAMALVMGYGWKVLSEDITHIDLTNDEIINFGSPFAIKLGAPDLIEAAVKADLTSVELSPAEPSAWIPLDSNSVGHNLKAPFDLIVYLEPFKGGDFSCEKISPAEYVRAILPGSNIARMRDAANKIYDYVLQGRCYRLAEGNLTQRLEKIIQLCEGTAVNKGEETPHEF